MSRGRYLVNLALNNAEENEESVENVSFSTENTDGNIEVHSVSDLPIFSEDNQEIGLMEGHFSCVFKNGK